MIKDDIIAHFMAVGIEPRKHIIKFDEEFAQLTRDEQKKIYDSLTVMVLAEASPEERCEMPREAYVSPTRGAQGRLGSEYEAARGTRRPAGKVPDGEWRPPVDAGLF